MSCDEERERDEGVLLAADIWRCPTCQWHARREPFESVRSEPPGLRRLQTVEKLVLKTRGHLTSDVARRHRLEDIEHVEERVNAKLDAVREAVKLEAQLEIAAERAAEVEAIIGDDPEAA